MILHLQTVPARNGANWIRHGFQVFKRKPMTLTGLLSAYVFLFFAIQFLPFVGSVLALMSMPLLSLAFMLATHQVLQNQTPTMAVFLAPFKLTPQRRKTQLQLYLAYALAMIVILMLTQWVVGNALENFMKLASTSAPPEQVAAASDDPRLFWGVVTLFGLSMLLSVPFWHASALVHWSGQGLMQALFSSTLAVWRNRRAFAYNGLLWLGWLLGANLVSSLLAGIVGDVRLLVLLIIPMNLLLTTAFYTSLYFIFIDCFMASTPTEEPQAPPSQP